MCTSPLIATSERLPCSCGGARACGMKHDDWSVLNSCSSCRQQRGSRPAGEGEGQQFRQTARAQPPPRARQQVSLLSLAGDPLNLQHDLLQTLLVAVLVHSSCPTHFGYQARPKDLAYLIRLDRSLRCCLCAARKPHIRYARTNTALHQRHVMRIAQVHKRECTPTRMHVQTYTRMHAHTRTHTVIF